jgi:hypothetical protein
VLTTQRHLHHCGTAADGGGGGPVTTAEPCLLF